jgi:hypothetical protein
MKIAESARQINALLNFNNSYSDYLQNNSSMNEEQAVQL